MTTSDYKKLLEDNQVARERMNRVTVSLSDTELARALGGGWTIASALVHLAFWDRRQTALLQRWKAQGVAPAPSDPDSINAAVECLAEAIPLRAAISLALSAAEAVDAEVRSLPADLVAAIEAAGYPNLLRRSVHRNAHLDDIERVLASGASK